jgi:hypothetical protein
MFRGCPGSSVRALPLLLLSFAALLASCEENTSPSITKFTVSPDCFVITEHTRATLDENGNLIHETEGRWAGQPRTVQEVVGSGFGRVEANVYNAGSGAPEQFPVEVRDNIAHVRRSTRSFDEIVANAEAAGADGLIISNNEGDGTLYRETLSRTTNLVVVVGTRQGGDALDGNDGAPGMVYISSMAITEEDPIIRNGQPYSEYMAVQFFGRASGGNKLDDPTGANAPLEFEWDMGDGGRYTNVTSGVHYYVQDGEYTVKLTVRDKDGDTDTREALVTVGAIGTDVDVMVIEAESAEPEPTYRTRIAAGDTTCIFTGYTIDFVGRLETPCRLSGLSEQYEWHWDFDDGEEVLHQNELSHLYAFDPEDVGPHVREVILTVTEQSSGVVRADTLQNCPDPAPEDCVDREVVVPEGPEPALEGVVAAWSLSPVFGLEGERCDFKGWDVPFWGGIQTPCGEVGSVATQRWQAIDWRWTFDDGSDTTGTNLARPFYPYVTGDPGPHSHDVDVTVHEVFLRPVDPPGSTQPETLATASDSYVVDLPAGRAIAIEEVIAEALEAEPAFHPEVVQGDTLCVFDGWDVQYIGTLDTPCAILFDPNAQYDWTWDFGDGSPPVTDAGSPLHRVVFDPGAPDSRTILSSLQIRDSWSNKSKTAFVQVEIPSGPEIAVNDLEGFAADPVPVFELLDGPVCLFVGWDVEFSAILETPCTTMEEPHPQYEWAWRFGDEAEGDPPLLNVARPVHRYAFDPDNPEERELSASLVVTDALSGRTAASFLVITLPEGPIEPPEGECPDNAKR